MNTVQEHKAQRISCPQQPDLEQPQKEITAHESSESAFGSIIETLNSYKG